MGIVSHKLLVGASVIALFGSETVFAQTATERAAPAPLAAPSSVASEPADATQTVGTNPPPPGEVGQEDVPSAAAPVTSDDVVVTGSRVRSGFQTPTPVTVASPDELKQAAPGNLADGLNQLPVFNGSTKTYQQTGGGLAGGTAGQNLLNLRNLGANRALVLLNGQRVVATNETGSVDVNILPQPLVRRVDVVTGGASAAYGSDAVAGVINFVLDTTFKGLKGEVNGGISTHGDSESFLGNLAFGTSWAEDRVRLIASVEHYRQEGVAITDKPTGRRWFDVASGQLPNPTTGARPTVLVVPDLKAALGSYGGLISSGPLRGTQFLANGVSAPFQYGVTSGTYMSGGDPNAGDPGSGLFPDQRRTTLFAHGEIDLADTVTLFADGLYARSHSTIQGALNFGTGSAGQLTIFRDNAFLPPDILARMIAANVQSIPLGRYYLEFGPTENESLVKTNRFTGGLKGKVFGDWNWDATYSWGRSKALLAKNNVPNLRNYFAASDAVRNTAGQIVCRSTLTGFDSGCVPLNPFGLNSVSREAADYITGDSYKNLTLKQQVLIGNLSGDLGESFQLGAGPISIAVGGEYRRESALQTADSVSTQVLTLAGLRTGVAPTSINNRLGPFQFYNPQPYRGKFNVKEAYGELGIPLLRDKSFFKLVDLSLAGRLTDYSQSGTVKTWKIGGSWQINDDIRLRYTRSRDIRGPNVVELFNTQTQTNQTIVYNGQTTQNVNLSSGNPNLRPERATTETYGFVYRPSWFSGFQLSIDRYDIEINGAIGNFSAQQTADQCALGNQDACAQIAVQANGTLIIRLQPLNLSVERNAGFDLESAYTTNLGAGSLQIRGLLSHITDAYRESPGVGRVVSLGAPTTPKLRGNLSVRYSQDAFAFFIQERFIGKSKIDPTRVEGVDTDENDVPLVAYTNLTASYRFSAFGRERQELFVSVNNVFDKEPPFSGGNPTSYNTPASNAYDTMGRYFTAGLRFNF